MGRWIRTGRWLGVVAVLAAGCGGPQVELTGEGGTADQLIDQVRHYPSGAVMVEESMRRGRRHGAWTRYYESGARMFAGAYKNGQRSGDWVEYYESGRVRATWSYKYGQLDGRWTTFADNGVKQQQRVWQGGQEMEVIDCAARGCF